MKDDRKDAKLRFELLPWGAITKVVEVLTLGAVKYAPRNWEKGMLYSRLWAASNRHGVAWWHGENKDPESGISHLAHRICCDLFLLSFHLMGFDSTPWDDRPGTIAYDEQVRAN